MLGVLYIAALAFQVRLLIVNLHMGANSPVSALMYFLFVLANLITIAYGALVYAYRAPGDSPAAGSSLIAKGIIVAVLSFAIVVGVTKKCGRKAWLTR